MLHFDIPADELCLHACGIFLDIHITIYFHFGHWTTLDVPGISHALVAMLSDVHLVYMGEGPYTLLCKHNESTTEERQHKTQLNQSVPETLSIKRTGESTNPQKDEQCIVHAEYPLELIVNQRSPQKSNDTYGLYSDDTEIYNLDNINYSSDTLIESTDTELYDLDENVINSLKKIDTNVEEVKGPKHKNKRKGKPRKLRIKSRSVSTQQNQSYKCGRS